MSEPKWPSPRDLFSMRGDVSAATLVRILRAGIWILAGISILGLAAELVFLRHWGGTQTIVWLGVGALSLALVLLVIRPSRKRIRAAQAIAVAAGLVAVLGFGFHTIENLGEGPEDENVGARWETMSGFDKLFAATTGKVGPAPTLAPGALAQIAALILLGSIGSYASPKPHGGEPAPTTIDDANESPGTS